MLILLMACVIVLPGCGESARNTGWGGYGTDDSDARLTIQDLEEPAGTRRADPEPPRRSVVHHRLVVQRMVFPRDEPRLRTAITSMIDEDEEESGTSRRRLWRANGFGIGRIIRNRVDQFLDNIPDPLTLHASTIHNASVYSPLTLTDVRGTQRVRIVAPDGSAEIIELTGGEYQMLLKLTPPITRTPSLPAAPLLGSSAIGVLPPGPAATASRAAESDAVRSGIVQIDLLPHHHDLSASLLPRSPWERILDGTSFDDLHVAQSIDPQQVWVIWADLPPRVSDEPDEDDSEGEEANEEKGEGEDGEEDDESDYDDANDADDESAAAESGPPRLAEAMLTGRTRDQAVQVMLLIGVEQP